MFVCVDVCVVAGTALSSPEERGRTLRQEGSVLATKSSIVIMSSEQTMQYSAVQSRGGGGNW
jgi:hypothetical protein